tara:strand:- start:174 stop:1154 length:981 start_codon:yes stop_codon:yes gene_type:complete
MSYIGVPPVSGDFVVLDAITTSATASYTLQRSSVNFAPESANHMLVSLNGTIQKPNSSFTISGSTITFSSALTSSDVIDFILVLGNVNAVGVATTVADDAITDAKTNFVSTSSSAGLQIRGDGTTDGTLQLNCSQNSHGIKLKSPAHSASQSYTLTFPTTAPSANKFLKTDGSGNLSFADAGGNTPAFEAYNNGDQSISNATYTKMEVDTERFDTDNNFASHRFTPTTAGKYFVYGKATLKLPGYKIYSHRIAIYKNGSLYVVNEGTMDDNNMLATPMTIVSIIDMNGSSDYLEIYAYLEKHGGSDGVFESDSPQSVFGAFKLGGA